MIYPTRSSSYVVTPTRRRICRPLLRRNYNSFASTILKNNAAKTAVLRLFGKLIRNEVSNLCSTGSKSVLSQSPRNISDFHIVNDSLKDIETRAPTLLSLLQGALQTKRPRTNTNCIIVMITSMLCKHRKHSTCLLQRIVSLVLYSGHSSKQVRIDDNYKANIFIVT